MVQSVKAGEDAIAPALTQMLTANLRFAEALATVREECCNYGGWDPKKKGGILEERVSWRI